MKIERVAFFDIDGTLFDPRKYDRPIHEQVPASTSEAILKLKANGVLPIIATGRWKEMTAGIGEYLNIDSFITSNGQAAYLEDDLLYQNYIDQQLVNPIIDQMRQRSLPAFFDTKEGIHILPQSKHVETYTKNITYLSETDYPENVLQMMVTTRDVRQVSDWLTSLKVVQTGETHVDIYPLGVSKAKGIERILDALNIDVKNTFAFGDANNDLEMFGHVGTAVAMGNGTDRAKESADFVTSEVWNDGIYKACEKLGLFE
ncbi:Cof-type HAD-IIB family hydrolase [Aerococcus agrisoli]|uniref:Cof-type HAD-IIB family hydrolase n=1 Tax=Aerococcus agrisoli TaxID=2487350 RepID=A0A3N4GA19_9LACT|nr:Cof-type HAD-IIB family hydrolase [Aerococcus agrisoli]RPA59592.1 Cof-type HAD-IIB family hydrolase [Aerococcus agrisoli]